MITKKARLMRWRLSWLLRKSSSCWQRADSTESYANTDFHEQFKGLLKQKVGERGENNLAKECLCAFAEMETSAHNGSIQTLTQHAHKLETQGYFSRFRSAVKLCYDPRLERRSNITAASGRVGWSITSVPLVLWHVPAARRAPLGSFLPSPWHSSAPTVSELGLIFYL